MTTYADGAAPLTSPVFVPDECRNPDVDLGIRALDAKAEQYAAAHEYDEIDLWSELDADTREAETLRQAGIEYDPNFCSVVIDAVNDRMAITSVTATNGEAEDAAGTALLADIWSDNQLGNYWPVWQRNGLRDGDGYVLVWPTEHGTLADEESAVGDVDEMVERADVADVQGVNITYVDPRNGIMIYDDDNPRIKRLFFQRWDLEPAEGEKKCHVRLNVHYPNRVEKYITRVAGQARTRKDFQQYVDDVALAEYEMGIAAYEGIDGDVVGEEYPAEPWPMLNEYGQIPAFHIRTDIQYGKPIHRNAWALQDAMSTLMRVLMVTVNFQGWPQAYALQEADSLKGQLISEDPLSSSPPSDWEGDYGQGLDLNRIPDNDEDGETGSRLMMAPGAIALLKGFKEIGQLDPANPATLLEPWREFAKTISSTTNTPLHKFQGLGNETPSGESLKVSERPLNSNVRKFHRLFGTTVAEFHEFALLVMGHADARVTVTWEPPETTDLLEVWELIEMQVRLGMPREVAFMRAGIPEAEARAWVGAGAETADLERRVSLLDAIATATQKLGASVSLGVLTPEQAQASVLRVLGELAGDDNPD